MPQGNPKPGEKYLHFKNKEYQVIVIGKHSETDEKMVVYQALYGDFGVCIRPYDMFISEVDHVKYPQVTQKYRFQYIGESAGDAAEHAAFEEHITEVPKQPAFAEKVTEEEKQAVPSEKAVEESGEEQANPWLMKFLDAEDFEGKYKIVSEMYPEIDDKLIDDLAVCLDVVIPEGRLQDRYLQLKQCIRTRQKYEGCRV